MRRYVNHPSRAAINAAIALQSPLTGKDKNTMSKTQTASDAGNTASDAGKPATKGVKFSELDIQTTQQEYIKPAELIGYPKFTILGARKRASNLNSGGQEVAFSVAIPVEKSDECPNGVLRRTVTLAVDETREKLLNAVNRNGIITGVRLDHIKTRNPNGYYKFVDADSEKGEVMDAIAAETPTDLTDDDIPF